MTRDFTISVYRKLLQKLSGTTYFFQTYHGFINDPSDKVILLRHDVDARKSHSLHFARIQHEMGIVGTYYFRMIPQSFDEEVVKEIASMGHEIGYHYEDMDFAKGDPHQAIHLFEKHLSQLREVTDVQTICMHGSPLSKYDNRDLWQYYDYRDYGIIAEPYFDLDFSRVLYLTDTGRRWDGDKVSIRDKVSWRRGGVELSSARSARVELLRDDEPALTVKSLSKEYSYRNTQDIINACKKGKLPNQIMFNFHPQRWIENPVLWAQELVMQRVKNVAKRALIKWRD